MEKRQAQIKLVIVCLLAFCTQKLGEACAMTMQLTIPLITSQEQPWLRAGALLLMCPSQWIPMATSPTDLFTSSKLTLAKTACDHPGLEYLSSFQTGLA